MTSRFSVHIWVLLLIFTAACGDEEKQKKVEDKTETTWIPGDLPAAEDPIISSEVETTDCAEVSPDAVIKISDLRYSSTIITVNTGDVVQWINDEEEIHSVTSQASIDGIPGEQFDLYSVAPGKTACARFEHPGQFDYFCRFHARQSHDDRIVVNR